MPASTRLRSTLAGACHALGAVWAVAGVLRLVFGTAVTFPLLPPIDLARVQTIPAFAAALGLFFVGAWIGRFARTPSAPKLSQPNVRSLPESPPDMTPQSRRSSEYEKSVGKQP